MFNTSIIPDIQIAYGNRFEQVWFMQDGTAAHRRIIITNKLRGAFAMRVIAFGFPTEWLPRSPDLTSCDYFLWGHIKNRVFQSPPPSLKGIGYLRVLLFLLLNLEA